MLSSLAESDAEAQALVAPLHLASLSVSGGIGSSSKGDLRVPRSNPFPPNGRRGCAW